MSKLILFCALLLGACNDPSGTGQIGPMGQTGPQGLAGTNGSNGNVVGSGIGCTKTDTSIVGLTITYYYESAFFTNGDRYATCSLIGNSTQYSNSILYKTGTTGATNGACFVTGDVDGASGGYWTFTSQSGTTKVIYTDPSSSNNGHSYTFGSSDCATF